MKLRKTLKTLASVTLSAAMLLGTAFCDTTISDTEMHSATGTMQLTVGSSADYSEGFIDLPALITLTQSDTNTTLYSADISVKVKADLRNHDMFYAYIQDKSIVDDALVDDGFDDCFQALEHYYSKNITLTNADDTLSTVTGTFKWYKQKVNMETMMLEDVPMPQKFALRHAQSDAASLNRMDHSQLAFNGGEDEIYVELGPQMNDTLCSVKDTVSLGIVEVVTDAGAGTFTGNFSIIYGFSQLSKLPFGISSTYSFTS